MAATIWTLLSIFVIAPSVHLPLTGPSSATGSGTSTLTRRWTTSEHSGVTGKTPHQVARAGSLRGITAREESGGGPISDSEAA